MESVRTPLAWALLREEIPEIGSLSDSERLRLAYSYNYLETVFENALFEHDHPFQEYVCPAAA